MLLAQGRNHGDPLQAVAGSEVGHRRAASRAPTTGMRALRPGCPGGTTVRVGNLP